jgi:hypothetical protein
MNRILGVTVATLTPKNGHRLSHVVATAAAAMATSSDEKGFGSHLSSATWEFSSNELVMLFVAGDKFATTLEEFRQLVRSRLSEMVPSADVDCTCVELTP